MKRVIKEEKEINLFNGARNVLAKLGTRKLAAVLTISSMLAISGCGKKEEVQTASVENTMTDDTNTVKYRNRALGGKIVDNHNQELYISKASDLEQVVNNTEVEETKNESKSTKGKSTKNQSSSKKSTTSNVGTNASTASTQTTSQDITVVDNSKVEQVNPDLMAGETVTYSDDGSYTVTPSQDYINPQEDNQETKPEQPSTGDAPVEEPPIKNPPVEEPVEPLENRYVVLKKNYPDGTYFYVFTNNNGSYDVQLIDVNYANNIDINSNIYALAENDEALSYALNEGWAKVGLYDISQYGPLDSVYNVEPECDRVVANALNTLKTADEEANKALTLTP